MGYKKVPKFDFGVPMRKFICSSFKKEKIRKIFVLLSSMVTVVMPELFTKNMFLNFFEHFFSTKYFPIVLVKSMSLKILQVTKIC